MIYSNDQKEKAFEDAKIFMLGKLPEGINTFQDLENLSHLISTDPHIHECFEHYTLSLKDLSTPFFPSAVKEINHPLDVEYFREYPAPIMEAIHATQHTNINSTIPFFGPMFYFLIRQLGCEQVLEIGHAEGYSSFYIASAVKDNATRYGMAGNKYYGIDICQSDKVRQELMKSNLPVNVFELDSMKLTPQTFPDVRFDFIFQDGNHDDEHVIYEFETMWPQLKLGGNSFWAAHDCYGPAEEGCRKLIQLIKDKKIPVEYIQIPGAYGLLLIRKLEGLDPEKRHWTN